MQYPVLNCVLSFVAVAAAVLRGYESRGGGYDSRGYGGYDSRGYGGYDSRGYGGYSGCVSHGRSEVHMFISMLCGSF